MSDLLPYTNDLSYSETIRLLASRLDPDKVEKCIQDWASYFMVNNLFGLDAEREFNQIITARVSAGCISLAAPSMADLV